MDAWNKSSGFGKHSKWCVRLVHAALQAKAERGISDLDPQFCICLFYTEQWGVIKQQSRVIILPWKAAVLKDREPLACYKIYISGFIKCGNIFVPSLIVPCFSRQHGRMTKKKHFDKHLAQCMYVWESAFGALPGKKTDQVPQGIMRTNMAMFLIHYMFFITLRCLQFLLCFAFFFLLNCLVMKS